MANKKIKFDMPKSAEFWADVRDLIDVAYELSLPEIDPQSPNILSKKLLFTQVHKALEDYRKVQDENHRQAGVGIIANQLAKVYEQIRDGKISDEKAREEIARMLCGDPFDDEMGIEVPTKEEIIEDRGPVEAAIKDAAFWLGKSERTIHNYRKLLRQKKVSLGITEGTRRYTRPQGEFMEKILIELMRFSPKQANALVSSVNVPQLGRSAEH